jgi:hypothetical protein
MLTLFRRVALFIIVLRRTVFITVVFIVIELRLTALRTVVVKVTDFDRPPQAVLSLLLLGNVKELVME